MLQGALSDHHGGKMKVRMDLSNLQIRSNSLWRPCCDCTSLFWEISC